MFLPLFSALRSGGVPCTLREYLSLLEGTKTGLVDYDIEGFYYLARAALVKDECAEPEGRSILARYEVALARWASDLGRDIEP